LDINHASSEGINNFSHFLMDTYLDILALTKELAQEISIDFVYYDAFGTGEIVKDYLKEPGFSSSASFLIPEEYNKNLP
ncbi:UDP-glucosyltransferase, partial [Anaerobacillus sp. 1_MG-2023]|nr:UDP-glucosyltransferase [Anaerobacillus sp. 1_MG-2023]